MFEQSNIPNNHKNLFTAEFPAVNSPIEKVIFANADDTYKPGM